MRRLIGVRADGLVTAIDLAGTAVFAVEGAMTAIANRLDLLGVLVLSFVTAVGGGIIRDVLIGAVPPQALRSWHYPVLAFTGGAATLAAHGAVQELPPLLLLGLDAVGLSLFAVAGTEKALEVGLPPISAIMLGGITGVGGGTLRDVLIGQVPRVLRVDVYAAAALAGAAVAVGGRRLGLAPATAALLGGIACLALRAASVWFRWNLPTIATPP